MRSDLVALPDLNSLDHIWLKAMDERSRRESLTRIKDGPRRKEEKKETKKKQIKYVEVIVT